MKKGKKIDFFFQTKLKYLELVFFTFKSHIILIQVNNQKNNVKYNIGNLLTEKILFINTFIQNVYSKASQ